MATTMAIPLQKWIRIARVSISEEEYLECAVSLALVLTKRLSQVAGTKSNVHNESSSQSFNFHWSWNDSSDFRVVDLLKSSGGNCDDEKLSPSLLGPVQLGDIVAENVLVSVEHENVNHNTTARATSTSLLATDVTIQPSNPSLSDLFTEPPKLSSQDVCYALGKILFELFSRGDSLLLIDMSCGEDNQNYFTKLLLECTDLDVEDDDHDGNIQPPSSKRSSVSSVTNHSPLTSTKAKYFLRERGMPLSICNLVSDLLESKRGNQYASDTALLFLEDAKYDLLQMKLHPDRFLHDQICPSKALEHTFLFNNQVDCELYGREREVSTLMDIAGRVTMHVPAPYGGVGTCTGFQIDSFLCEACFISGHSGSGKSEIIKQLVSFCNTNDWAVLICKFDRQVSPLLTLLQACDTYFQKFIPQKDVDGTALERDAYTQEAFDRIRQSVASVDGESMGQLYGLLPSFSTLFPMPIDYVFTSSASGGVGSGSNRLKFLFHIIFTAICSGGHPVALILEDCQWTDVSTVEIIGDYIQTEGYSSVYPAARQALQRGLLYVGSFRDDEVTENGFLMNHINCLEKPQGNVKVTRLFVGELPLQDINNLLSSKFCLPKRRTQNLAELVIHKTRGNPMHVIEFLRSIIKNNMMVFSVRERRWIWDDKIDLQISEGVAELLTKKLRLLPSDTIVALQVMSCFGYSINLTIISLLDLGQFVTDMTKALDLALTEGIIEKAGQTSYAFSHDMLLEQTYNLISANERKQLHKEIAMSLIQDPEITQEITFLAADQINACRDILAPVERAKFASLNLSAGKCAMRLSNYEQARAYFEAAIALLHTNHWAKQYALSLELYELSVQVSFMDGKISIDTVSTRLNEILSNATSFDDALNARALHGKLLVSQEKYADGVKCILQILKELGEEFPQQKVEKSHAISEIKSMIPMLQNITKEKILSLPAMTDSRKLKAMALMGLLTTFSHFYSPMLVQILACQMIRHTFRFGYCEDTISCLVYLSHGLLLHVEELELAKKMSRIAQALIAGNSNEHALRARLTVMSSTVASILEPSEASIVQLLEGYNSATIIGDVDNAMLCAVGFCAASLCCSTDLQLLYDKIIRFMHEMAKHRRNGFLHSTMSFFSACAAFTGNKALQTVDGVEIKTNDQLAQIAEQTQNSYLMHHVIISQMFVKCYFREYLPVTKWAEENQRTRTAKRVMDILADFYQGIAVLGLARDTKQEQWRQLGEKCLRNVTSVAGCAWNTENKIFLLQAELHYTNNRHKMADLSYQASIVSAHDHMQLREEALAYELYGIFLLENKKVQKGLEQLRAAGTKYKKWGANRKYEDVKEFVKQVKQSTAFCVNK